MEAETGDDDGGCGGVMHDESESLQRLAAAAGCYCCFHLPRYFLRCWKVDSCSRHCGGGGFHDGAYYGDGCCDGGCHSCWCHGHCLRDGTGLETMRRRKGNWKAGSSHP